MANVLPAEKRLRVMVAIVTNVPASDASAVAIAALYRKRWTLETMFFELTQERPDLRDSTK